MFRQYFEFKDWADARTIEATSRLDESSDTFAFITQQLNHMIIIEELFHARLLGRSDPHNETNSAVLPSFAVLKLRKMALNQQFLGYVNIADEKEVEREISFVFKDGKPGMMRVHEILFHIITHGSYHRGNIAHALDLAGMPHPVDGFGLYIHEAEPLRRNLKNLA